MGVNLIVVCHVSRTHRLKEFVHQVLSSTDSQKKKIDRSSGGAAGTPRLGLWTFSLVFFQGATINTPIQNLHCFCTILVGRGRVSQLLEVGIIIKFSKIVEHCFN